MPEPPANPFQDGENVLTELNTRDADIRAWVNEVAATIPTGGGGGGTSSVFVPTQRQLDILAVLGLLTQGTTYEVPADSAYLARDTFANRTVVSGVGTPSDGGTWTVSGAGSGFAVDTNVIHMTLSAVNDVKALIRNDKTSVDQEVGFAIAPVTTMTAGAWQAVAYLRATDATTNTGYRFRLNQPFGGNATLVAQRNVSSGTYTDMTPTVTLGFALVPGTTYRLRTQVTGTASPVLKAKVWSEAVLEPATWSSWTDTTNAYTAAGRPGMYARATGTLAPVPFVVNMTDFYAFNVAAA